jgi:hypothetical protein
MRKSPRKRRTAPIDRTKEENAAVTDAEPPERRKLPHEEAIPGEAD